ncbi:hypothetical protein [Bosea rubneri]|uniref:Uncharacterized protein n=1 Tax=Bosea rubneri TaxID=3075434 RepID=A0ABU3SH33_9HYPH|nr:hypothetical protein [Bosea sp. ZW T0_25]MDU0343695.1 hypothetical protein [Bosea sp. ZW T0_25]
MFITVPDGTRINLNSVKYIEVGDLNRSGLIDCRFEFNDGTGRPYAISQELLALIDATMSQRRV